MNHIYRIVWNTATACYQAVSESATGQGKGQGKSTVVQGTASSTANDWALTATAIGAALCMLSLPSFAGPAGGQVTAGSATITQAGTATTINQTSNRAAIDWTKFSVGANESVRFNQPSASALTLNRVTGTESSAIMGRLSANGQVFILNPNGVLFGASAQVNVGGLVASTLQMSNANFMAGNYKFAGDAAGSVINNGHITVAPGGTLALMAPVVQNTGTLSAPGGSVLLAGAQAVTLTLQTNGGLVAYTLDAGSAQALVDNGGLIQAGGGHVVLTAKGVDALSKAVVNHSGIIEAQTVGSKNGVIELLGDMQSGTVSVSGKLDASAPNADGKGGDGGFIDTSAANVKIADTTRVTTAAAAGQTGMWLIDPTDFTINAGGGSLPPSSGIAASTLNASLSITNATIATSAAGTGNGDIFVNSAVNWSANKLTLSAHRNININATMTATGSGQLALNYGQATTTGAGSDYVLGSGAQVNLSAGQNFSTKQGSAGTVKNYTVITTLGAAGSTTGTDLQGMNGGLSGNYVLGKDIDATATTAWSNGAGFLQVGYQNNPFSGVLDGLGHVVSYLYINRPNDNEVGLIGTLTQGAVRNISVTDVSVTGHSTVGGLIGAMRWGSNLKNAYSTGTVRGTGQILSSGQVDGAAGIGGLVGGGTPYISYPSNGYSYCTNCISIDGGASSATVYGNSSVGGLIGFTDQTSIRNSYATGNVNGVTVGSQLSSYIGGLVGNYFNSTALSNSYAAAAVNSTGTVAVGGLVGSDRSGTISASYFDSQKSGTLANTGGTSKTTAQMQQQSTYVGWNFVNTWEFLPGNTYPTLRAFQPAPVVVPLPVVATPPATTVTATVEPPAPIDVSIAGSKTPATNLVMPVQPTPGAGSTIPRIGDVICVSFGACSARGIVSVIKNDTQTETIKKYLTDPLIDEGFADLASTTLAVLFDFLENNELATKMGISQFLGSKSNLSEKIRSKIFDEATRVDLKDMTKGAVVTLLSNMIKEILKNELKIDKSTYEGAYENWQIDQMFIFGQIALTGGSPLAALIAESQQTLAYVNDLYQLSNSIQAQNTSNITSLANVLNGCANVFSKAVNVDDPIKKEAFIKIGNDSLGFTNSEILPNISLGILISGEYLKPITKDLVLAKTALLNGNTLLASSLISKTITYSYQVGGGSEDSGVVLAVKQLVRDMGLSVAANQMGPG